METVKVALQETKPKIFLGENYPELIMKEGKDLVKILQTVYWWPGGVWCSPLGNFSKEFPAPGPLAKYIEVYGRIENLSLST